MATTFTASAIISDGELLNFAISLGYIKAEDSDTDELELCKEFIASKFKKSAENFAGQWVYNKSESARMSINNQLTQDVSSIIDVTFE